MPPKVLTIRADKWSAASPYGLQISNGVTGRALSQINKVMSPCHNFLVLKYPGWSKTEITPKMAAECGRYIPRTYKSYFYR